MEAFAYYECPFGFLKIGHEDGRIFWAKRVDHPGSDHCPSPVSDLAAAQFREYFEGERKSFDFPMAPKGTPFQLAVWAALLQIPYGEIRSYRDIAETIGNPKACRAVGMANNKNPIWIAIPCHRVVGSDRSLTGYAGGLDMKRALLKLERLRFISLETTHCRKTHR